MCVLIFSTFLRNISHFLSDFTETWNFLDRVSKNIQIPNFMLIRLVGAELFHADGQTDMTKLIVAILRTRLIQYVRHGYCVTHQRSIPAHRLNITAYRGHVASCSRTDVPHSERNTPRVQNPILYCSIRK